jgi:hypothetical protein
MHHKTTACVKYGTLPHRYTTAIRVTLLAAYCSTSG